VTPELMRESLAGTRLPAIGSRKGRWRTVLLGSVPFVVMMLAWELFGRLDLEALRYVLPTPEAVAGALYEDFSSGVLWKHIVITMEEVFWGVLIAVAAALLIGVMIGRSELLERIFYPIIVFFQAVPKVALAPLWLIVFGFGIGSKVALAAMVGFFPMLVGVIVGMSAMRREEVDLMRSLKATQWQIFTKVQLPRAVPSIFGGLEVGLLFALIGAVVGEFVGARAGLGYLINFRSTRLDLPGVFAPLVVLALIGLALDLGAKLVGRRLMTWQGE
jgi:NitT/TauT family transport system permease protein